MRRGALAPRNRPIYHKTVIMAVTVAPISHAMYAENASHLQMVDAIKAWVLKKSLRLAGEI
jgi:hypothetical protein